jgi:hypothetical protein
MLTIKNYSRDISKGVFYGWDMTLATEDDSFYSFEFEHRSEQKRVYVLLHREASYSGLHRMYIQDMNDEWKKDVQLTPNKLNKHTFYNFIESIIDDEYQLPLPF